MGTAEFVRNHAQQRLEKEQVLLDWLPKMSDLQCAWLLLALCATPRANHIVRALPPTQARDYAAEHDSRIWETLKNLLGHTPSRGRARRARDLATLPGRLGGLGLRSAERTSPAAYWASWADALDVIRQRRPNEAAAYLAELERVGGSQAPCLRAVQEAAALLDHEGFALAGVGARPSWRELFEGARPPTREDRGDTEPGEWIHGWQFYASSTRETFYREHHLMPNMSRASLATLRSQSGPQAAAWLTTVPTSPATTLPPVLMQICLRRRLRLPLMLSNRQCEGCEAILDDLGDHRAACPVSGRLRRRAKPMELAWSAIFAEAGAVVADQVLLRDTNIEGIASGDRRQIDFVAWGVRGFSRPICGDATIVSPLHSDGTPYALTPDIDGASFLRAVARKEATYPELARQNQYGELTVLACETGGRWHHRALTMVAKLIEAKTQTIVPLLRQAAALAYHRRWWGILSTALQRTVATSLLDHPRMGNMPGPGPEPPLGDLLEIAMEIPEVSRLPLRDD